MSYKKKGVGCANVGPVSYRNRAAARPWSVAMDHDAAHKYIYSLDSVVADLLRLVVPDWAELLDLAAPENVSAEYFDEAHRKRVGDMVWKVYFRDDALDGGGRPYILVLVEFQLADKQSQVYDLQRINS